MSRGDEGQMGYTDAELERFLGDLEADFLERKESWNGSAPEGGREAVCAFANDLPDHRQPGVLFVGVNDRGVPTKLPITDVLLRTLADMKTDGSILPPPTIFVQKRQLLGVDCGVVTVLPADSPPVSYRGRTWIRIGPRRGIATAQDERILSEKRRHRDLPFDIQEVPSSSLRDLNKSVFENDYLPNAVARDVLETNERTYEQRLASCRMVVSPDKPVPTILGLLAVGVAARDWVPAAYIQFLRIAGKELTDPISDEMAIDGTLAQILNRIDEKLSAHNQVSVDIREAVEKRTSQYPAITLQQLIRNAIMHRTYEGTNAPVRVYWFDDRIEISNPGGPFGSVTKENFGKPGITDYRNPHLAEAMKVLGFVQRFGVGIATAQAELKKNGNPEAKFDIEQNSVLVTIYRKP